MTRSPDVLVVGGGAIGAACALELARRGAQVELLEAGDGWAGGCSPGSAGLIVPSHAAPLATAAALRDGLRWLGRADSPFALHPRPALAPWLAQFVRAALSGARRTHAATALVRALAVESLQSWAQLAPGRLQRDGVLNVYASEAGLAAGREEAAAYTAAGLRCELLDARAARELEPALAGPLAGAILFPDEAHGDPRALVTTLGEAAAAQGVRVRFGVAAQALLPGGGVRTSAGDVAAGRVVLAAGLASARLGGVRLPLAAGVGCSVDVRDGLARPRLPVFLHEARVVATPLAERVRLAGTLELSAAGSGRVAAAPPDARRVAGVLAAGRAGLVADGLWRTDPPWAGARPCTPDGLPLVGALRERPEVVVATGHAMLGLTLAPVTARLVADALDGTPPPAALAPERFHVRIPRRKADVAAR